MRLKVRASVLRGLLGSLPFVLAWLFRLPSPLRDAATGAFASDARLEVPWTHLVLAPPSLFADWLTTAGTWQDATALCYLVFGWWLRRAWAWRRDRVEPRLLRETLLYLAYLGGLLAFFAWALLWPRPSARLVAADPDDAVLDLHSHTNASWDGRRSLSVEASAAWHRRLGYDAFFVTDHNSVEASRAGKDWSRGRPLERPAVLEGTEVSLHQTHIVLLGAKERVDTRPYDGSLEGTRRFLADARAKHGGLPVMSLPEYWRYHAARWEDFAAWGAAGFELSNGSPRSLDFPERDRRRLVGLCRRRGLFLVGVTDSHGWGSTGPAWTLLRIPGHRAMDPDALEDAVLAALRARPAEARVLERIRHDSASDAFLLLSPFLGLWTFLRTLSGAQTAACLAWVWLLALLPRWVGRKSAVGAVPGL